MKFGLCLILQSSVKELLSRDSFCAQEIDIFKSVKNWAMENEGEDSSEIMKAVRLPLMTMQELLNEVRLSGLVSPNAILDAIQTQTESRDMELQYRGFLGELIDYLPNDKTLD